MQATQLLKKDHALLKRLFAEFRRTPARAHRKRRELADRISGELEIHARIEEELLYPAIATLPEARHAVTEARADHEAVKMLIIDIVGLDGTSPELDERMDDLREIVVAHATEEEDEMFPLAHLLGESCLERIGAELAARKHALTEQLAPSRRHTAA